MLYYELMGDCGLGTCCVGWGYQHTSFRYFGYGRRRSSISGNREKSRANKVYALASGPIPIHVSSSTLLDSLARRLHHRSRCLNIMQREKAFKLRIKRESSLAWWVSTKKKNNNYFFLCILNLLF